MVQKLIADAMAEAVVDVLEAIEIDEDDGDLRFRRLRFEDLPAQKLQKWRRIWQLCDRVEVSVPPDHFLGALLFGGVCEQRHRLAPPLTALTLTRARKGSPSLRFSQSSPAHWPAARRECAAAASKPASRRAKIHGSILRPHAFSAEKPVNLTNELLTSMIERSPSKITIPSELFSYTEAASRACTSAFAFVAERA